MTQVAHRYLVDKGIRPSHQRIAVMNYLLNNFTHPTADEIFISLSDDMPTLSKTTVYNTLKLLVEYNAILSLDIDGKNCRYDGNTKAHAHFMCNGCGCIYDIPLKDVDFVNEKDVENFKITDVFLYMKGYCKDCEELLTQKK